MYGDPPLSLEVLRPRDTMPPASAWPVYAYWTIPLSRAMSSNNSTVRSLFPPQGSPLSLFPFMVNLLKKLSAFLLSISPLSHSIRLLSPPFHHSHSCKPLISMSPKASSPSCLDPFLLPLFLIHSLAPSRSPPLLPALNHWGPGAQPSDSPPPHCDSKYLLQANGQKST